MDYLLVRGRKLSILGSMIVLGLDFETSGISPNEDRVIEIGAVLWDCDRKTPIDIMGKLIKQEGIRLSPEITEITGILDEDLENHGYDATASLKELHGLLSRCDYVVAHNGNRFDKLFLEQEVKRAGLGELNWTKPWIDTLTDLPLPDSIRTRKLSYLAVEHQLFNPLPHRAVFDVIVMLQLFSKYPVEEVVSLAESPTIEVRADVTYDDRALAKDCGYRWDGGRKMWVKTIKQVHFEGEQQRAKFDVIEVLVG